MLLDMDSSDLDVVKDFVNTKDYLVQSDLLISSVY